MINPMSMEGQTVIVTGASSGIGRETAVLLGKLGAKLFLMDINGDELKRTQEILCSLNVSSEICAVDLTASDLVKNGFKSARDKLCSAFTGLVHCAGIPSVLPLRALSEEQYEKVMSINTKAGLNLAKLFSSRQGHDSSRRCSIVFISSVYGVVGSAANVAYSASKAAVIGITKALAIELAPKNIRVNCIAPGFIKTNMADNVNSMFDAKYADRIEEMHPLGWGEAIDVANAVAFLLSEASKWTTGALLSVDGGFTAQ